jgi:hypothetical protein
MVATATPFIHPNLAEVNRQQMEPLHAALHDPTTREEAFDLIRSLIEEIRLVPEEGEFADRAERRPGRNLGAGGRRQDTRKPRRRQGC